MALTVAELSADLAIDSRQFDTGLQGILGKFGKFGPVAAAAGGAIVAGLAVAVKAALDLGGSFDDAYDTIRIGTGATGKELEGLQEDFKAVFADVPTDMASVSTAIADLNTRLGLTGKPLQDLSKQFIDLSRITGTDLKTNIASVTRVFGDWQISAKDQAGALDAMFRATQASGIGFDQLSTSVVKFGAPMRNLGFSFEESLALLSQFDKAGVNTQTVFAGLRQGVGKLAKEGEAVPETFSRIVGEIEAMGPGTEATALAIELFGQRAGPDLADAITGGKFAIDEMMGAISGGKDTIRGVAKDTDDWKESLNVLKNKVLVGLEPIVMALFDAVGWLADAFVKLSENKDVQEFFRDVGDTARSLVDTFLEMIAPITAHWDAIKSVIKAALGVIADVIRAVMAIIRGDWDKAWGHIKSAASTVWDGIKAVVRAAIDAVADKLRGAMDSIKGAWSGAWDTMKEIVSGAWGRIKDAVSDGIGALGELIKSLPRKIKGWLGDLGKLLWNAGRDLINGLIGGIREKLSDLWDLISSIGSQISKAWSNILGEHSPSRVFWAHGRNLMQGLALGISESASLPMGSLAALAGKLAVPALADGGVAPTFGSTRAPRDSYPTVVEEHYHIHMPGGTTIVGSAETVGRMIAPAIGRESRIAEQRRARRR